MEQRNKLEEVEKLIELAQRNQVALDNITFNVIVFNVYGNEATKELVEQIKVQLEPRESNLIESKGE